MLLTNGYEIANAVTTVPEEVKPVIRLSSELGATYSEQQIKVIVDEYSIKYGVDSTRVLETIRCESRFKNVQSGIVSQGIREDSWGIVQIHLPSHPTISKQQALQPEFALEWMVKQFSNGKAKQWSCYRTLYSI